MDTVFQILWATRAAQSSGRVSVFLHFGYGDLPLAENIPDTGGLLVDIGSMRLPNIDFFKVKVADAGNPDLMDFSVLFSIRPAHDFRVYFRGPEAGAILKLDSFYDFGLDLPPGPPQDFDILLMRNDTAIAKLPAGISGSELKVRLSGQGVGSGGRFRFRLLGRQGSDYSQPYFGMSETFSIASDYFGGADFSRPGPLDTLIAGSADTLVYAERGNPGVTVVSGIYWDSVFVRDVPILGRSDSGGAQRVAWTVPMGMKTGSRYRIGIASESDPGLPISLSPRFAILGVEPDVFEYDNVRDSAKQLRLGEAAQMRTLPEGDTDWVWFDAEAGKPLAILIRGVGFFNLTAIQDTSETGLASRNYDSWPDKSIFTFTPEKSGRCRVRIGSAWVMRQKERYSYSLSLHPMSLDSTGLLLGFTAPHAETRVRAGSASAVRWSPDTVFFDSLARVDLYRDSTRVQILSDAAPNSGAFDWNVDPWMESSPRYRIRISHPGDAGVFGFSPQFAIDGKPRDPYEPDGERISAKRIEPGGAAQSRSLLVSDTDWAFFDCAPGGGYRIEVKSGFPLILSVFSDLQQTTGGISPVLSQVKGSGRCAIQVESFQSQHGEYDLSVSLEAAP